MRALPLLALWLAVPGIAAAQPPADLIADEDDPKLAREAPNAPAPAAPAATAATAPATAPPTAEAVKPATTRATAFLDLTYRGLTLRDLDGGDIAASAVHLDVYALSQRWFRVGVEAEFGWGSRNFSAMYVTTGLVAGFQYPWRITPFVDFRFAAGLIGGDVLGKTIVSYIWQTGLEAGLSLFLVGGLHVTAALGWVHPVYRGIDIAYTKTHPLSDPVAMDFAGDSFTFKVGFGI